MKNAQQLANRFREVILDGKWIANTNWKEQVSGLTWQQTTTSIHDLNSIALLTFHLHYYIAGILNVLKGGSLDIRDKYSLDMPLHPTSNFLNPKEIFVLFCTLPRIFLGQRFSNKLRDA